MFTVEVSCWGHRFGQNAPESLPRCWASFCPSSYKNGREVEPKGHRTVRGLECAVFPGAFRVDVLSNSVCVCVCVGRCSTCHSQRNILDVIERLVSVLQTPWSWEQHTVIYQTWENTLKSGCREYAGCLLLKSQEKNL